MSSKKLRDKKKKTDKRIIIDENSDKWKTEILLVPEKTDINVWKKYLQDDDDETFCCLLIEEILQLAFSQFYENNLWRRLPHHVVQCFRRDFLEFMEYTNISKVSDSFLECEKLIDSDSKLLEIDSWAPGALPAVSPLSENDANNSASK